MGKIKTKQEIFDTVVQHLLTQKQQSTGDYGVCSYRGGDGLKCAIGVLITDEAYSPKLEDNPTTGALVLDALRASGCPTGTEFRSFYSRLQGIHDFESPFMWKVELIALATREGLQFNCSEQLEMNFE